MSSDDGQPALFDLPPPLALAAAPPNAEHVALSRALPAGLSLGTMSWSYPGWAGIVYGERADARDLATRGLEAYAAHPLLGAVEIDRTYYEPLPAAELRALASQTPEGFRFVVKAHEECVVRTFPTHARYGKKRGERSAHYLDAAYVADHVVAPFVEGLGDKGAALLFQFPPQEVGEPAPAFAERLGRFLGDLPRDLPHGATYAVELRNADLLTPAYVNALVASGAVHCHNAWPRMPPVIAQARRVPPEARRPLFIRWLMRHGDAYERALARSAPFDRIVAEDPEGRAAIANLVTQAARHEVPVVVLVDNKAEGCAPESIVRLARAIAAR